MKANMNVLSLVMLCVCTALGISASATPLVEVGNPGSGMQLQFAKSAAATPSDERLSVNFGQVTANMRSFIYIKVTNTEDRPLAMTRVTIGGTGYNADTDCPLVLEPQKECLTRISFWPPWRGSFFGQLIWYTDDGDIIVDLWGQGV